MSNKSKFTVSNMLASNQVKVVEMSEQGTRRLTGTLPPDIIAATLPFLDVEDIRNLSLTNKYYNKLLDYKSSTTLWRELFHKSFGTLDTNEEPFQCKDSHDFNICVEKIMLNRFPQLSWHELYDIRHFNTELYTWGCLKHARLGYTAASNDHLNDEVLNGASRFKTGVNYPTKVPWFPKDADDRDRTIIQISSGGFSFQILTSSGKIFSTGPTYTGGHKGTAYPDGDHDYNPFREAIRSLEGSYPRIFLGSSQPHINTTGTASSQLPGNQSTNPQRDIYKEIEELEEKATENVPGNKHLRRMFTRDSFPIYNGIANDFHVDMEKLGARKFIAVASGRSHFIALTTDNEIYSWDNSESNHGIRITFEGLPQRDTHPIIKIASGWDFNCAYIFKIGLVVWNERDAIKKGDISSNAHYKVIPNTSDISGPKHMVDFTCVQRNVVYYIDNRGDKLWMFDKGAVCSYDLPIDGKLLKVISCLSSLVLFTSKKCFSIGLNEGKLELESITELTIDDPDDSIISLCSGDYHTLALTSQGQIYTWGVESQFSGCFGLGRPQHIVDELHIGKWEGPRNVKIMKPAKLSLDADQFCIAIAAGGWQSGALIVNKNGP